MGRRKGLRFQVEEMGVKLGLLTYDIAKDWDLQTLLDRAREIGFEGIEFRVDLNQSHGVELDRTKKERKRIREMFRAAGIAICGLGSGCMYDSPNPTVLKENIERTKGLLALTADVGAPGLKVFGNTFHEREGIPREQTLRQVVEAVRECGLFAKDLGVDLRFEMHGDFNHWEYAVRVVEEAGNGNVNLIYNSDPRDVVNGSVAETIGHVIKHVKHIHMHELVDPQYPSREMLRIFKGARYEGYCVAEVQESPDSLRVLRYYKTLWEAYIQG
jgi:sugar phosphate isomerase/epimerase